MPPLLFSLLLLVAAGQAPSFDEAANLTSTGLAPAPITLRNGVWEGDPSVPGSAARLRVELLTSVPVTGDLTGGSTPESEKELPGYLSRQWPPSRSSITDLLSGLKR